MSTSFQSKRDLFSRETGIIKRCQFHAKFNCDRVYDGLSLSKHRDVKVVGHGAITSVAIDPLESRYILSGSSDGLIAIYDAQNSSGSPKHVAEIVGITSNNRSSATSVVQWYPSDNGLFVSSGADGQLKVWDANVLKEPVESFLLSKRIYCHHLSSLQPSQVAVASNTNHVRLVDLKSGSSTHELRGHTTSIVSVQWSPASSWILASGCHGGQVLLWDVRRAKNCLLSFDMGHLRGKAKRRKREECLAHKGSVNGLCFSNDGRHLISYGCYDGRLRKWDILQDINTKTPFEALSKVTDVKVHLSLCNSGGSLDCKDEVVFVPAKADVVMMRLSDGRRIKNLSGHFKSVTSCAFSADHLELFSGGSDRAILIWDCLDLKDYQEEEERPKKRDQSLKLNPLTADAWSSDSD